MSESTATKQVTQKWYARPVLFVSTLKSLSASTSTSWVSRTGRQDKGRLFVELTRDGIDELRREILERSVPTEKAWWGCDGIQIADPDGNELLFPLDETNDRDRQA